MIHTIGMSFPDDSSPKIIQGLENVLYAEDPQALRASIRIFSAVGKAAGPISIGNSASNLEHRSLAY